MPRIARIALEGVPYHITQRGNARQIVFFDDADHLLYLDLLGRSAVEARLRIQAYCLMPNHIHLIATPARSDSMANALGRTHADFARYFNLKHRGCGHVWQARYFSCPLDRAHFSRALAYVERNPLRAGLVNRAEDYRWSSAGSRAGETAGPGFLDLEGWHGELSAGAGSKVLASDVGELEFGVRLAAASVRGRPLGDKAFFAELEKKTGRRLRARPVGRPKQIVQTFEAQVEMDIGI